MRRAQTDKLVEVQCEKGALGEEKGVAPELPAGSQCPELAQHVDTEPGPDLKSPFLPEGKRWRDSRIRATSASWSLVYFFFFSLWSHWLTALFSFSLFLVFDFFFFAILASALILDVIPLACCLPERGQMQSVVPGRVRNAAFHSKTVQQGESLSTWTQGLSPPSLLLGLIRRERESGGVVVFISILYITV